MCAGGSRSPPLRLHTTGTATPLDSPEAGSTLPPNFTASKRTETRNLACAANADRGSRRRSEYSDAVERAIVGYHQDDVGEGVAELACGHARHVRHRPPFQLRPWVVDVEGRRERLGTLLECGLC